MSQSPDLTRNALFEAKLEELAMEFADLLAPKLCSEHPDSPCDCDPAFTPEIPVENVRPSEILILQNWTCLDDGESYYTYYEPGEQLLTHSLGLVRVVQLNLEARVR